MVNISICEGNPGCIAFVRQAYSLSPFEAEKAFQRMDNNEIHGDKLYMLWNDCCDRDTEKAIKIMLFNTIENIKEHINYEHGRGIKYE